MSLEELARNKESARKDLEEKLTSFVAYANGLLGNTLDGIRGDQFIQYVKNLNDTINFYKNQSETLLEKIATLEKDMTKSGYRFTLSL